MKIVVINGSPKGKDSNTNIMVRSFLKGAQEAGAETINIFLAEKEIEHCKGCHTCWVRGPGQCVIHDDMLGIISQMGGANIICFASPVYFENIAGMLKMFMDRMTMIGGPGSQASPREDQQHMEPARVEGPKLMMISSCGHADRSEFDVTSLWIHRVAEKMHMELAGEIYATQSKILTNPPDQLRSAVSSYLQLLETAGKEIATSMKLSAITEKKLEQGLISI
ncbi:putative NADPH-quinone reductase [Anaerosolibacter carboniphilus]|uniref:Putative NADPH-quinone reductase n=1 Tax=Anaerosolibacter carboniphilus TaxID=1417629 RepID=A0A841L140_9FIRM|nr:flavodoxin family protein [Anaerosolibacter carboniphilus]MBB6216099.1 putative NADPH-quinone reductase [Anaerosolibacter carboniphilus]